MRRKMDVSEIEVAVDHPMVGGPVWMPLRAWIALGPGPEPCVRRVGPVAARRRGSSEPLPLRVVPLRFRNNRLSNLLVSLGFLRDPWDPGVRREKAWPAVLYYRRLLRHRVPSLRRREDLEEFWRQRDPDREDLETFYVAIGLLCYGRLDVADVLLDLLSRPNVVRGWHRMIGAAVKHLIPIPAGLDPLDVDHHAAIKSWIRDHSDRLSWNDVGGYFGLRRSGPARPGAPGASRSPQRSRAEAWFGVCPFDYGNGMLRARTCQHCHQTSLLCDECQFTCRVNERTIHALLAREIPPYSGEEDRHAFWDAWAASADSALRDEPRIHWPRCPYCGDGLSGAAPASTGEIEAVGLTPYFRGHGG